VKGKYGRVKLFEAAGRWMRRFAVFFFVQNNIFKRGWEEKRLLVLHHSF
jgi:hypothetical protein